MTENNVLSKLQATLGLSSEQTEQVGRALSTPEGEQAIEILAGSVLEMHMKLQETEEARVEAERESMTDELTGLPNRRAFLGALEQEVKEVTRYPIRTSLLAFLDLNGFKRVNDECGHEKGDEVLKDVGKLLKAAFRDTDVVARLGGDEFTILFMGENEPVSIERTREKIQEVFNGLIYTHDKKEYSINTSIGLVEITHNTIGQFESSADILKAADERMYEHKGQDPNRVLREPESPLLQ